MNNQIERIPIGDESGINNQRVRIRYRDGNTEIEIEGPPDYIDQRAPAFLQAIVRPATSSGTTSVTREDMLPTGQVDNTASQQALIEEDNVVQPKEQSIDPPLDLLSFYRMKAPADQQDQVLVITWYYQKYQNLEHLSLEDYGEAYQQLRRLGVETPSNMKSTVRNVVDRTKPKLLYNPVRGRFGLTVPGEEYVQQMGNAT